MKKKIKPLSTKKAKTYPLKKRKSKVAGEKLARVYGKGASFSEFMDTLPGILAAEDIKAVVSAIIKAKKNGRTVALSMGAHVIKTGLTPLVVDMMEAGIIDSIAMNGACVVHDFELAYAGATSEDVDKELKTGKFGMAKETGELINGAINKGVKKGLGIGASVGEMIKRSRYAGKDKSILAAGARLGIPVTVHVALGTDIIHLHPSMDGALTGLGTQRDFELFAGVVATLDKGVFINIGSAVIMPEVFLKALTLARNTGHRVRDITTVNMDFIQHYRPVTNVVRRPTMTGGRGITLTGHHEIMVPLLFAAVKEAMK
ncbi:MAG: hypothetical protein KAR06_04560 [Deltaproteobacteria bacterium]|nr:hypothetical protein [Deltaproteobacteria bacterium]